MNILQIIDKKRNGLSLSEEEINYFIKGYVDEDIQDYQASALLMAICINGMNDEESVYLTNAMIESGDTLDLSSISGIKVDKHSTGGVSDTTSICLVPLLACKGLKVAKMSGRGLGHTGGTLDKLSVFDGIKLDRQADEICKIVERVGGVIVSQTGNLAPADKKLYALRDATSTVQSIPLVASSVMSKKIASGNDIIVLDIKVGEGAFMKNNEEARHLARLCIEIGRAHNKKTSAVISDMNAPLGNTVGCALETMESIGVLRGEKGRLTDLVFVLYREILKHAGMTTSREEFDELIASGAPLDKLKEIISALGGSVEFFDKTLTPNATFKAQKEGYITAITPTKLGLLVNDLGGGRKNKTDSINTNVGIKLLVHIGDYVTKDTVIAEGYDIKDSQLDFVQTELNNLIKIDSQNTTTPPLVVEIID